MREGRIEVRPSKDGQHYWRKVAANGEVLFTSETYRSKAGAKGAAEAEAEAEGHPPVIVIDEPAKD
jgi:uncharacterized protein YegP (UPF0339 family)